MAETEAGEYTHALDQLVGRLISEGEHPTGSGDYDFTEGLHVRTDGTRRELAKDALDKEYKEVVASLGSVSFRPEHWGNVFGVLSFPTLVRIAADSSLIETDARNISQTELRRAMAKKAGYEAAEFGSARVDLETSAGSIFRPKVGHATSDQLRVGMAVLARFQNDVIAKAAQGATPRAQRV